MKKYYYLILVLIFSVSCGASSKKTNDSISNSDPTAGDTAGGTVEETTDEPILTDKLIGTPFEDMTIGDDVPWCKFLESDYLTITVTEEDLPIPIFLAFFTASEEEIVKEGVQLANDTIGYNLYQVVDTWCDHCRLILKVNTIYDQRAEELEIPESYYEGKTGHTNNYYYSFGQKFSSTVVTDWTIEIKINAFDNDLADELVAHELGHATGILYHFLIDYVADDLVELEANSIMASSLESDPTLNDYTKMMQKQFEILQNHYGQSEENGESICP